MKSFELRHQSHVYIAYEPTDYAFAVRLNETLKRHSVVTWLDLEKVRASGRSLEERQSAMRNAYAIVFVMSDSTRFKSFSLFERRALRGMTRHNEGKLSNGIICLFGASQNRVEIPFTPLEYYDCIHDEADYMPLLLDKLAELICNKYEMRFVKPDPPTVLEDANGILFLPDEVDLYCNRETGECYIFHAKDVDYDIKRIKYYHDKMRMMFVYEDGRALDLGVSFRWSVRPTFAQANEVRVSQTKDGKTVREVTIPIEHKNPLDDFVTLEALFEGLKPYVSVPRDDSLDRDWISKHK